MADEIKISNNVSITLNDFMAVKDNKYIYMPINEIGQVNIHQKSNIECELRKAGCIITKGDVGSYIIFRGMDIDARVAYTKFLITARTNLQQMEIIEKNLELTGNKRVLLQENQENQKEWAVVASGSAKLKIINSNTPTATSDSEYISNVKLEKVENETNIYNLTFDFTSKKNIPDDFAGEFTGDIIISLPDDAWQYEVGKKEPLIQKIPAKLKVTKRETIYIKTSDEKLNISSGERVRSGSVWHSIATGSCVLNTDSVTNITAKTNNQLYIKNIKVTPRADTPSIYDLSFTYQSYDNIVDDATWSDKGQIILLFNDTITGQQHTHTLNVSFKALKRTNIPSLKVQRNTSGSVATANKREYIDDTNYAVFVDDSATITIANIDIDNITYVANSNTTQWESAEYNLYKNIVISKQEGATSKSGKLNLNYRLQSPLNIADEYKGYFAGNITIVGKDIITHREISTKYYINLQVNPAEAGGGQLDAKIALLERKYTQSVEAVEKFQNFIKSKNITGAYIYHNRGREGIKRISDGVHFADPRTDDHYKKFVYFEHNDKVYYVWTTNQQNGDYNHHPLYVHAVVYADWNTGVYRFISYEECRNNNYDLGWHYSYHYLTDFKSGDTVVDISNEFNELAQHIAPFKIKREIDELKAQK